MRNGSSIAEAYAVSLPIILPEGWQHYCAVHEADVLVKAVFAALKTDLPNHRLRDVAGWLALEWAEQANTTLDGLAACAYEREDGECPRCVENLERIREEKPGGNSTTQR